MEKDTVPFFPTLFSQHALHLKKAKEDIINNGPYLLTFSVTSKQGKIDKITANIEHYLTPVDPNNNPMQKQIAKMEREFWGHNTYLPHLLKRQNKIGVGSCL